MSYTAPPHGFRTFIALWASQSVSSFGTLLTFFALNIWLVQEVYPLPEQQPQLGWALAATGLAIGFPATLITPIAGAMADRLDRKRIMLTMDLVSGTIMALTTYLILSGQMQIWLMLMLLSGLSVSYAFHRVAFDTSYAMLVSDEQLPRANGMMETAYSLGEFLSPAAAAALIALPVLAQQGALPGGLGNLLAGISNGTALVMAIDTATFFLAATVLAFLTIPSPKRADLAQGGAKKPSIWSDVRFGAVYIWRRRPLLLLLLTVAIWNILTKMGVFLPVLVKVQLAADWALRSMSYEAALAAMNMAMTAGGLAGGLLISLWGGAKRNRIMVLMLSLAATGLMQIWLGFSSHLSMAMGAIFLWQFAVPFSTTHSHAIWQSQVPREMQGRVFAIRRVVAFGLLPLGQLVAGLVVGMASPGIGLAVLGALIVLLCVGMLFNPTLMRVEDREYMERLAGEAAVGD
ncbi:MAG: MFS transporter [Bacillota bacterium]